MKHSKNDLVHAQNLIKIIKRGQYQFSGMESLAFSDACKWFNGLVEFMEKEFAPAAQPMKIEPMKPAVKEKSKQSNPKKKK